MKRKLTSQDIRDDLETLYRTGGGYPDVDPALLSARRHLIRVLSLILYDKYTTPNPNLSEVR